MVYYGLCFRGRNSSATLSVASLPLVFGEFFLIWKKGHPFYYSKLHTPSLFILGQRPNLTSLLLHLYILLPILCSFTLESWTKCKFRPYPWGKNPGLPDENRERFVPAGTCISAMGGMFILLTSEFIRIQGFVPAFVFYRSGNVMRDGHS